MRPNKEGFPEGISAVPQSDVPVASSRREGIRGKLPAGGSFETG